MQLKGLEWTLSPPPPLLTCPHPLGQERYLLAEVSAFKRSVLECHEGCHILN